jgi:GntR family transcriptional regulator, sialic acid-inducible nan operon repressor
MTVSSADPIPRRRLYQEVADRLLERLQQGEFAAGGRMPSEREIMETYAVGRPAVREALLTLERMGLISILHGERARINEPTAQTMMDQIASTARYILSTSPQHRGFLREARLFFETGMVRIAAERATRSDVRKLETVLAEQDRNRSDLDAFGEGDMAFHREIARISGNAIFVAVSQATSQWLMQYRRDLIQLRGAQNVTIAEHRRILERIARRDAAGAAEAMADHLTRANEAYRRFETASDASKD